MVNLDYNMTVDTTSLFDSSSYHSTTTYKKSDSSTTDILTDYSSYTNYVSEGSPENSSSTSTYNATENESIHSLDEIHSTYTPEYTGNNTLATIVESGKTTVSSISSLQENGTTQVNGTAVTTHVVTNIFSEIQTVTIINGSQVTTQTLPNSEVTTKTLSDQIMTLGVPIATVTSTFTGEDVGTTLTTPIFMPTTTIFPNYHFKYTQFYIITSDSVFGKREQKDVSTIMEVLLNVSDQPKTTTITTNIQYYSLNLKNNVNSQNMVVLNHFTNSHSTKSKHLGAIIGGTLGGVFGAILISMILFKWYVQRRSKDIDDTETVNPANDGFSHHSGRRINVFEETELLEYYSKPSQDNFFFKILEKLHLKSSSSEDKMVDPFNDEFDFKSRQMQPPVIVEKTAKDIVDESNPFSDGNETSFFGSNHSYDSQVLMEMDRTNLANELESEEMEENDRDDDDYGSVVLDAVSMSSLCPNKEVKENGMLLEIV